jgi:hypothetical protein
MLLGLSLFYVGAVLILNGLWMLGRISDREITVINLFTGGLNLLVSLKLTLGEGADAASIKAGAFSLLFALTYLWVAFNRLTGADGRGLGWFSLFVAITAVPIAIDTLSVASTPWSWWFGLSWAAWALLWLLFFLVLVLNKPLTRLTAGMAIAQGILTGWLPGYLLLTGAIAYGHTDSSACGWIEATGSRQGPAHKKKT